MGVKFYAHKRSKALARGPATRCTAKVNFLQLPDFRSKVGVFEPLEFATGLFPSVPRVIAAIGDRAGAARTNATRQTVPKPFRAGSNGLRTPTKLLSHHLDP